MRYFRSHSGAVLALLVLSGLTVAPCRATAQVEGEAWVNGRAYDAETGGPLAGVTVEIASGVRRVLADSSGHFVVNRLVPGSVSIRAWKLGYAGADTTILVKPGENALEIRLRVQPIALLPLTVTAQREGGGADVERALFDREATPGLVGISGREIRDIPALAEPDVLRSLQAFPGVVMLNDLSAQLHVRGGGPDQNLFVFDGARIFAPYHLFGMFGAFNTDAVERVEFFRAALPARYGGALSSVVHVEQRDGPHAGQSVDGGISLLGARFAARGALPGNGAAWSLAGRRSHVEAMEALRGGDLPYEFYDVQGGVTLHPSSRHQVTASVFASSDRFRMLFGVGDFGTNDEDLDSRWRNTAGSLRWTYRRGGAWGADVTVWGSGYSGDLLVGDDPGAGPTLNRVGAGGLRAEVSRRGTNSGLRFGADLQAGQIRLAGSGSPGSYFSGEIQRSYMLPALYAEAEQWFGRVRLMPGLRAVHDARAGDVLLEPRLGARLHFTPDLALTAAAGRSHQILSALRDDRYILPGAPFWFVHPEDSPASRTDGLTAALEGWVGAYSFDLGVYARSFQDVPRWTPVGTRDLAGLSFDDGNALGIEASVRKHAGRLTGWIGYGLGRVSMTEEGTARDYFAAWDRRHSVDVAVFFRPRSRLSLSGRVVYGSGLPFRAFAGYVTKVRMNPWYGRPDTYSTHFPLWAEQQSRYPAYFRADLGARYGFRLWGADVEPFLNVQNVTARPNVLYYRLASEFGSGEPLLYPEIPFPFTVIPSLGVDVHF